MSVCCTAGAGFLTEDPDHEVSQTRQEAVLPCAQPQSARRWETGSYGYHGDDGRKFFQSSHGEDYGPRFTTGDVVGACLHLDNQELSFTCAPPCTRPASCSASYT